MVGPRRHNLVEIGAEAKATLGAFAFARELDGDERRVLDGDAAALDRGDERIGAIILAPQNRGEELDEAGTGDRGAAVEPGAVAGDPHLEIAVIDDGAILPRRLLAAVAVSRRGSAGGGIIH